MASFFFKNFLFIFKVNVLKDFLDWAYLIFMRFVSNYNVRSSEIGADYRLKQSSAAFFFQECVAEYFTSKGFAGYDMAKISMTWLVSDMVMHFVSQMPFWRDKVTSTVWIRSASALRMFVDFEASGADGEIFAKAEASYLVADSLNHRPCRIAECFSAFEPDSQNAIDGFENISKQCSGLSFDSMEGAIERKVRFDDIDFNSHLTNAKYLPRAIESLPDGFIASHSLCGYSIKFKREAKLGDSITSRTVHSDTCARHELSRSGEQIATIDSLWALK